MNARRNAIAGGVAVVMLVGIGVAILVPVSPPDADAPRAAPVLPPAPLVRESRPDLDAAVQRVFDQWRAQQLAALRDAASPHFQKQRSLAWLADLHEDYTLAAGELVRVVPWFTYRTSPDGDPIVDGVAMFARGPALFSLTFHAADGAPQLLTFTLELPPGIQPQPNPADADAFVQAAVDALVAGQVPRALMMPDLVPLLGEPGEFEKRVAAFLAKLGPIGSVTLVRQPPCDESNGRCYVYKLVGAKETKHITIEVEYQLTRWRIAEFRLRR